ncbi:MAG: Gfo/Idh/MocA family oxidoreductase [Candidatus Binataceae bacterium]|nr:Gfo/Idh/MocA family oxidoreductase [Candidatus Binataceae bacterium]
MIQHGNRPHSTLRFGILGAARIVPKGLIQPASEVREIEIVAIASRDPARAREFATAHKIPEVLNTYAEVISHPRLDAIYIPLPNSMHCEWSLRALRAGKHVLCEKPIACNAREAERMARVADETGLILAEAFHYRHHPLATRIKAVIESGVLGELLHLEAEFMAQIRPPNIRFQYELGGGATMDLGCYPLNMLRHFSGSIPQVRRARAQVGPPGIDLSMEADFDLSGGATARMRCSMASAQVSVFFAARGARGELSVTNPVAPQQGHVLTIQTAAEKSSETILGDSSFVHQLRAFAAAIRGEQPIVTDAIEAVANMRLIDEVYSAAGLSPRGL